MSNVPLPFKNLAALIMKSRCRSVGHLPSKGKTLKHTKHLPFLVTSIDYLRSATKNTGQTTTRRKKNPVTSLSVGCAHCFGKPLRTKPFPHQFPAKRLWGRPEVQLKFNNFTFTLNEAGTPVSEGMQDSKLYWVFGPSQHFSVTHEHHTP